ncbi:MAG: insulinase family protein [Alphaproteobacteria bacterium]|nr:insulinase family protein [Alphaproteobacteria bacterium]
MLKILINGLFASLAVLVLTPLLAVPPAHAVEIDRVKSPGGIEAWLVRDQSNPIISMRFAFRGGSALDPADRGGLANMTASLLDEGAGDMDSKAFQGTLEDLVITLRFSAQRDSLGGQLVTLTENRDIAFKLLKLALTKARFDAEPVERIRSQILAEIRQNTEDPGAIASKSLFKRLFPDHPYGRPKNGTAKSVAAITRADLKAFTKRRLGKNNLIIGVVGDIAPDTLSAALDDVFGSLADKAAAWDIPETAPESDGRTLVVEKNMPQSSIVFADKGLKRDHPDFYAAYLMNHILGGGGFTSRLYNTIREKRGLAYSVYSGLHPLKRAGLLFGGAGTTNAKVSDTLRLLKQEWTRMAETGATKEELADAKTYQTGSYPLRFTSSGSIAGMLVGIQMNALGIDYMDRRNSLIEAVTITDVNRVAKTLLRPDRLSIVIVGKPNGVKSTP